MNFSFHLSSNTKHGIINACRHGRLRKYHYWEMAAKNRRSYFSFPEYLKGIPSFSHHILGRITRSDAGNPPWLHCLCQVGAEDVITWLTVSRRDWRDLSLHSLDGPPSWIKCSRPTMTSPDSTSQLCHFVVALHHYNKHPNGQWACIRELRARFTQACGRCKHSIA